MTKSKTYCVMPHIGLAIQNNGDVCVCNINKLSLKVKDSGNTIDKHSISEFWNSETRHALAQELDSGVRSSSCSHCWNLENSGNVSARQEHNKQFADIIPDTNQPLVFILKPGNSCNSACRYCDPSTSSSWYHDAYELTKKDIPFKDYIKKFETIRHSFSLNNPHFWPVIGDWYKKLRFVDIYGGEPWTVAGLWRSLREAVECGYSKNIALQLHTNATHWNAEYMKILRQFKSVRIGLSIDSHIPQQFNYVRHKSDYETVIENSKHFIEYVNATPNMTVYISTTVGILNVWDITETVDTITSILGAKVKFTNFVYDPHHYDIRHLPKSIKSTVINKLQSKPQFEPIIKFMNTTVQLSEIYWPKFCLETEKLDAIRNQSFSLTFPEWYAILKPYWDYKKRHSEWYGVV